MSGGYNGFSYADIAEVVGIRKTSIHHHFPTLPEWHGASIPLYIVYPPNRHLGHKVRVFVDWLVNLLATAKLNEFYDHQVFSTKPDCVGPSE